MFYHLDLYILPVLSGIPIGKPWGAKAHKSTQKHQPAGLAQGSPSEGGPSAGFRTKNARFYALVFCCCF